MSDPDVTKTVTALNAGWYNVVNQALGLDPATFQLAQGSLGLQTSDSSGLFLMSDAQPPSASVTYYDAGGMKKWSDGYSQLLLALKPEEFSDLDTVLGDRYVQWLNYLLAYTWPTAPAPQPTTQQELFTKWANMTLPPGLTSRAIASYSKSASAPLVKALDALQNPAMKQQFADSAGNPFSLYRYSATGDNARAGIATGKSAVIKFDSSSMETKLTHTTVNGSASGFYDIFSAGASGSLDKLSKMAAGSKLTVEGTIGKYATLTTQPLEWFNSGEVSRGRNGQGDNNIWDPRANLGDWNSFFGPANGLLARRVSQLVLVSDYEMTVTSHASYTSEDATKVTAEAEFGVWPFFSAHGSASHETKATLNNDGTMSVSYRLPKGDIQIWGVTVQDVQ